jgi:hypothetical protein
VDVHGEDSVCLEFPEFFQGEVGTALLGGTEFVETLHLFEEDAVVGFVCPTGLRVDFHLTDAVCLEEGEDVALEGLEFELAFREALLEELGLEGIVMASFARIVFEDGCGVCLKAVCGLLSVFGFSLHCERGPLVVNSGEELKLSPIQKLQGWLWGLDGDLREVIEGLGDKV